MALFSRGSWAIAGLKPESLDAFKLALSSEIKMYETSQFLARIQTKSKNTVNVGINPYDQPRLDECITDQTIIESVIVALEQVKDTDTKLIPGLEVQPGFAVGADKFALSPNLDWFGLWVVENSYKDINDKKSKLEHIAYNTIKRPFKFLNKEEKKGVEQAAAASDTVTRRQFPVLLNFNTGRVYIGSSKKDDVETVRLLLADLDAQTYSLAWDFGGGSWPVQFLKTVFATTHYSAEFGKRAEEALTFKPDQIEPLDDKGMEKIVSQFFALSELETGLWAGLCPSAVLQLTPGGSGVSFGEPTDVTNTFIKFDKAELQAASVVFQELNTKFKKNGDEYPVRKDLFSLDFGGSMNLVEVGAALLPGFDLPGLRKEILRNIKKNKSDLEISEYWKTQLAMMEDAVHLFAENIQLTLGVEYKDGRKMGLVAMNDNVSSNQEVEVSSEDGED